MSLPLDPRPDAGDSRRLRPRRAVRRGELGRFALRVFRAAAFNLCLCVVAGLSAVPLAAHGPNPVEQLRGRAESEVWSAPFEIFAGRTVQELALPERLDRMGFARVHRRPRITREYFWGHEIFWIREARWRSGGEEQPERLVGLVLERPSGRITGFVDETERPLARTSVVLGPELLAESLERDRARRIRVEVKQLPEHVWQAVLAAEDHRFFDHPGIDARSIGRALVRNVRAGEVRQGGSTLTQQLVKNRQLTPKRTLGRKISEAARALALESEHAKQDILEAYLNSVYLGHHDGLAVHGFGTAARVYFSKDATELDLAEAALLAGVIRSPNRLSPTRHPEAARERRDTVLGRLAELGWIEEPRIDEARARPVRVRPSRPEPPPAPHFLDWVRAVAAEEAPRRLERGRGVVVETTLDPWLQARAEDMVRRAGRKLSRDARGPVELALVALDTATGGVVAHVGGTGSDEFDRARRGRRQPGSAIKPLVLLEAFETCGPRDPVHPATRIADEPLRIDLPSGAWEPRNDDRAHKGVVPLRRALEESRNVPFVRLARWCGFEETADRLRRAGLDLPDPAPPSFVLGSVEATPLELAAAYTVFGSPGQRLAPRPVVRLERPGGRGLEGFRVRDRRVTSAAAAWLVRDLLRSVVEEGTARTAALADTAVWAKTGTSSGRRDAWMAGLAGRIALVLWAGRDDGAAADLSGSRLGAWWGEVAAAAAAIYPLEERGPPSGVVERWVDPDSGLLVRSWSKGARREVFRRGAEPRRDRFWRADEPDPPIR